MDCVICNKPIKPLLHPITGEVVWEHGNNALPVAEGQCCDDCNTRVVLEKRLQNVWAGKDRYGGKRLS
jgi:hypothetical protein